MTSDSPNREPTNRADPDLTSEADRPRRAKPIHWFALQAAIIGLLLGWAPGENSVYPKLFQFQANGLFGWQAAERWLEFSWIDPESRLDRSDTRMLGMARGVGSDQVDDSARESERRFRAVFSVRRRGYWPLVTWLALMLATPMPRRVRRIAVGAFALHALLVAQIALIAVCAFGATGPVPSPLWERGAAIATRLFNSPVPTYSLLFVLWAWLANPAEGIALSSAVATSRRWLGLGQRQPR